MKKYVLYLASFALLFAGSVLAAEKAKEAGAKADEGASAKRLTLIKFDKGEMYGDGTDNELVKTSLSKEKAEKGKMYSCKIEAKKRSGDSEVGAGLPGISKSAGILSGKRGNWEAYDTLNIKYFLEGDKPLTMTMMIGDVASYEKWRYGNYVERTVTFRPGENILSQDITGLSCSGGRSLDLKNMRGFNFWMPNRSEDVVLYVLDTYLEKDE